MCLADSPAQVGGRSAALTQNVPERVFSLVGLMICAADGPPLGRGRSAGFLTICTGDIVVSGTCPPVTSNFHQSQTCSLVRLWTVRAPWSGLSALVQSALKLVLFQILSKRR